MVTKEILDEYIRQYSQGKPTISDEEYDQLLEEYINEHGDESRPFLRSQQSDDVNDIVGTLPKAYGVVTPMREGQKTYIKWVETKNINKDLRIIIQPKFDGCSIGLDCMTGRFYTRGDYDNGESVDVTDLFAPHFDMTFDDDITAVKFEAIMAHELFDDIKPTRADGTAYKRARDAVSGTITSRNVELAKYITLVPLRYYRAGKQYVPNSLEDISIVTATVGDTDTIQQFIDDKLYDGATVEYNNGGHYSIDGVVVSVIDNDCSTIPENEIAIKILNNIQETKIINIDYQYGKTGKITPVGILEPVKFDNITVDHVGLSTLDRVSSLNLKYGDTVRIVYNIVPYLLDSYHDGTYPIPLPTKCPVCGSPLNLRVLKTVRCTNPNCEGLRIGMITRYCEQMKMMGLSKGILSKLFDAGYISSIPDLYKLTPERIQELDGFKEKSANNICEAIRKASENVPLNRWLGSLPIKDVSAKTWQIIIESSFGKDEFKASNAVKNHLMNGTPESFMGEIVGSCTYGIGVQTFRLIKEGLTTYWDDISKTVEYVTFKITTDLTKPIKGRVTLTGTRDEKLISYLIEKGYDVNDFSSKTIALVVPFESYVSNKVVKAKAKGIPVYTIEEAYRELT